jgi:hypothetical protein
MDIVDNEHEWATRFARTPEGNLLELVQNCGGACCIHMVKAWR